MNFWDEENALKLFMVWLQNFMNILEIAELCTLNG